MRVLVVATRGPEKSSTFYRWTQIAPVLTRAGVEIEHLYKPDIRRRRLRAIPPCDWVLNLRCLLDRFSARATAARGRHVCFDFDDAIHARPGRPYPWYLARRVARRLGYWLARARLVTTSSAHLARYAAGRARRVEVIPMALDLDAWPAVAPREDDGAFRIGWVGSPATRFQLERLDAPLAALLARHPAARLAVYCGEPPVLRAPFEHVPYEPGADRAFIRSLDVGLLPLERDPFALGKSPIKALQYLACGVPVVANRFGATAEMLDDRNSVGVTEEGGWIPALETLMREPERRRGLGAAGRRRVETDHDAAKTGRRLLDLLREEARYLLEPFSRRTPTIMLTRSIRQCWHRIFAARDCADAIGRLRALESTLPSPESRFAVPFAFRGRGAFRRIEPRQNATEIESLYRRVLAARPAAVLEIGTARGGTLYLWTQAARDDAVIVSVDLPGGDFGGAYPRCRLPFYERFARPEQRLHLLLDDSHRPETLAAVRERLDGRALDFAFIDGDHTRSGVRRDFEMYGPLVRAGGLIAFHDILARPAFPDIEVHRFWAEIRGRYSSCELIGDEGAGPRVGIGLIEVPDGGVDAGTDD